MTTEDERGEAGEAGEIEFDDSSIVDTTAAPRVSDAHMRSTATRGIEGFQVELNEELKKGKKIHAIFGTFIYPDTVTICTEEFYNEIKDEISQFKSTCSNPKQTLPKKRSRRITQEVKDKVWNRDGGKCVDCGSNENLEFDHIIPFSKGGANTYRNIQLLCEPCNRSKSAKIG